MAEALEGERKIIPPLPDLVSEAIKRYKSQETYTVHGRETYYGTWNAAADVLSEVVEKGVSSSDLFLNLLEQTTVTPRELPTALESLYDDWDQLFEALSGDIVTVEMWKEEPELKEEDKRRDEMMVARRKEGT